MSARIVMACPTYPPRDVTCGVGDYTRCLTEELARQGEDVSVQTSAGYRGRADARPTVRGALDTAVTWWDDADVVHIQYTPELYRRRRRALWAPVRGRRAGHPATVVTFHTLLDGTLRSGWRVPWLLWRADHCISANEEVSAMIRRRLPLLAHRITEIPIGSNIVDGSASRARAQEGVAAGTSGGGREVLSRAGVPEGRVLIAHFGLIYPGKGLETLLAALAVLQRAEPRVHLLVLGDTRPADRAYQLDLRARAERLGVAGAVTWAGRRGSAEVSALLAACELFVVPYDAGASLRRGSLMAGLEHGRAVVSTRSTLDSAYLRDGDNIALVPPRDPAALAARLQSLLAAPEERTRLGRGARALAERCAWPAIARQTREVYRRVAGA